MKLISFTLTNNQEDKIVDALRSIKDVVDKCLVIDTGVTDRTIELAQEEVGAKLLSFKHPWDNNFSTVFNEALARCASFGNTAYYPHESVWAIRVDTDERIRNVSTLRELLEQTNSHVDFKLVRKADGTDTRERIFRLPAKGRFVGPTHEAYIDGGLGEEIPLVRCEELPKNESQLGIKFAHNIQILEKQTQDNPIDPRWWYYLGDSYQGLHHFADHYFGDVPKGNLLEKAIFAYQTCIGLPGWDEQSAWAAFRAAECYIGLGDYQEAIKICGIGLSKHAGIAELAWLAAYANFKQNNMPQAIYWAKISIAMGEYAGFGRTVFRINFRRVNALYELPYDVLRFAYEQMGNVEKATQYDSSYKSAMTTRKKKYRLST